MFSVVQKVVIPSLMNNFQGISGRKRPFRISSKRQKLEKVNFSGKAKIDLKRQINNDHYTANDELSIENLMLIDNLEQENAELHRLREDRKILFQRELFKNVMVNAGLWSNYKRNDEVWRKIVPQHIRDIAKRLRKQADKIAIRDDSDNDLFVNNYSDDDSDDDYNM